MRKCWGQSTAEYGSLLQRWLVGISGRQLLWQIICGRQPVDFLVVVDYRILHLLIIAACATIRNMFCPGINEIHCYVENTPFSVFRLVIAIYLLKLL